MYKIDFPRRVSLEQGAEGCVRGKLQTRTRHEFIQKWLYI